MIEEYRSVVSFMIFFLKDLNCAGVDESFFITIWHTARQKQLKILFSGLEESKKKAIPHQNEVHMDLGPKTCVKFVARQ